MECIQLSWRDQSMELSSHDNRSYIGHILLYNLLCQLGLRICCKMLAISSFNPNILVLALTFRKSHQMNKTPCPNYLLLLGCSLISNITSPATWSVPLHPEFLHCFHADGHELPTSHPQQSLTFLGTCDFPLCFPSLPPTTQTRDHRAVTPWKTARRGS